MHYRIALMGILCLAVTRTLPAAEIVLEQSAVEGLVKQTLFNDKGRYVLQRGPCYIHFESPSVKVADGRVTIRANLSARMGLPSGTECIGATASTWLRMSGEPEVKGNGVLGLKNIRVHDVQDPSVRQLLEGTLASALPGAVQFDVAAAATKMLEGGASGWQASIDQLTFDAVSANSGRLSIKFDFKVTAR